MRYLVMTLLALMLLSCGSSSTSTPDLVGTQAIDITPSAKASIAGPEATVTNAPYPTSIPTQIATVTAKPSPSITPMPTTKATQVVSNVLPTSSPSPTPTPVTTTRNPDSMLMVLVPAGDFTMGSPAGEGGDDEVPQHTVTLDGYWIDRTEVTNDQYRIFVSATGYQQPTTCDWGDPTFDDMAMANHPVVCVSWEDALAYCKWTGARLPTEAEWEKAARGTDRRTYPWGSSFDGTLTNFCDVNCEGDQKDTAFNDGFARTAPVGSFPGGASPYGALDMAGNVWEWVSDWYNFYYYGKSPQVDPPGPDYGEYRVGRGGSWYGYFTNERVTFRAWMDPSNRDMVTGFRCVVPLTSP